MEPNPDKTGVVFGIEKDVPQVEGGPAARREHDRKLGAGTMSRAGAKCPCCKTAIMTMEDIRLEGQAGRLGAVMTAVVVDNPKGQKKGQTLGEAAAFDMEEESIKGKDYRLPTIEEIQCAEDAEKEVASVFREIPFGLPNEKIIEDAKRNTWCVPYGVNQFRKLFNPRQVLALGTFVKKTRSVREKMIAARYPDEWLEAVEGYLALAVDRIADRGSSVCSWTVSWDKIRNTFTRFALPIAWDFAESVTSEDSSGGYPGAIDWIGMFITHALQFASKSPHPIAKQGSATSQIAEQYDVIITDPPYYDAIGYSVLMDFWAFPLRSCYEHFIRGMASISALF
jgi:adenine-specific DNA methylase